jgi:hypothetical protein
MADNKCDSVEIFTLNSVNISPNKCPIDSPLALDLAFTLAQSLSSAHWEFRYTVDYASKRHIIELGKSEAVQYNQGSNHYEFKVDKIDVAGVKGSVLLNVGLLSCELYDNNNNQLVVQIKIVTQVNKNKEGQLIRLMFDPLA